MRPPDPQLGEVIDECLRRHQMRPADLARRLDVYSGEVSRWRRGGGISIGNVRKIADLFGLDRSRLEALAGYGEQDAAPSDPLEMRLDQVGRQVAAETTADLRGIEPAYWPSILDAQRAARRAAIAVARLTVAPPNHTAARPPQTARPARSREPRPARQRRHHLDPPASGLLDATPEYIDQTAPHLLMVPDYRRRFAGRHHHAYSRTYRRAGTMVLRRHTPGRGNLCPEASGNKSAERAVGR